MPNHTIQLSSKQKIADAELLKHIKVAYPPLILAIEQDDVKLVESLLQNGESPNADPGPGWNSPLRTTIHKWNIDIIELLVEYGAKTTFALPCQDQNTYALTKAKEFTFKCPSNSTIKTDYGMVNTLVKLFWIAFGREQGKALELYKQVPQLHTYLPAPCFNKRCINDYDNEQIFVQENLSYKAFKTKVKAYKYNSSPSISATVIPKILHTVYDFLLTKLKKSAQLYLRNITLI